MQNIALFLFHHSATVKSVELFSLFFCRRHAEDGLVNVATRIFNTRESENFMIQRKDD